MDKEKCPSTALILEPAEAAKLANEAIQWVKNGAPYSMVQLGSKEIKCPAPIFVAECKEDGTCFCVCKDKETCPSTALILEPAEAAKLCKEAIQWVQNGAPYSLAQLSDKDIKCPAPIFVAECKDDGTCFCVCMDKEKCPSTALILEPAEAAKLAKEAIEWVKNGAPYSMVQLDNQDIKCPAPIFVAECKDDGTCFCVCKDKETCPSTALILEPAEAAKLCKEAIQWVQNGAPYSLTQAQGTVMDITCPAPIFVAECKSDGTCFCVCKDKETCPSTALILEPAAAAKLAKEAIEWVKNGAPYSFAQVSGNDIKCPAPIFVAECKDDGTCFCVCKDKAKCPSTVLILEPAEAAKLAKEAIEWVKNGAPYSMVQLGSQEIKCPAPIFVAECKDDGTCFCVCKDKETCPSTALILEPAEAAKLCKEAIQWVQNGAPYSLAQSGGHTSFLQLM
jgi:CRISPR/Cas system-associated endoribonuclease Cas2